MKQILAHFSGIDATSTKNPKEIFAADIQKDLLLLEEQEGSVNFKFGVVYMKPGQRCDDEMLSNGTYMYTCACHSILSERYAYAYSGKFYIVISNLN